MLITNAARDIKADVTRKVRTGSTKLRLVKTEKGWCYAAKHGTKMVCIGKPLTTRQLARNDAERRYGQRASEFRVKAKAA